MASAEREPIAGFWEPGSEQIWMKFGELRVYCLELSLANFGRDPRRSGSGTASRNCFFLSVKRRAISPTSGRPNFTKFAQKDVFSCPHVGLWKTFVKICPQGVFFPNKTSILALSKSTISYFRPRFLRNDYKSRKSHDRLDRLWNVDFPLTPLE